MQITLNGKHYGFRKGETILDIAKRHGIEIPTLCHHPMLSAEGRCRICLVKAGEKFVTACDAIAEKGMIVFTETKELKKMRKEAVDLIASSVEPDALREDNELTEAMKKVGLRKPSYRHHERLAIDRSSNAVWRNNNRCIACGRCVQSCSDIQSVDAIAFSGRGDRMIIEGVGKESLAETDCVSCGQCSLVCPTNAITEAKDVKNVEHALSNKKKLKVVQIAPSVRVSLGECFGMPPGKIATGKIVAALRKAGFDIVFDTNFGADLTIVEESAEFAEKAKKRKLPLFTSCCPAWVDFCCEFYPELVQHLSTAKSPQLILAAMLKTYYAKKQGVKAENIVSVSIMPCTAKKKEASLREMHSSKVGKQDIDFVLTTRELAELLKRKKIDLRKIKAEKFDSPLGESTGAGAIFGVTGGVMEAALRTAYFLMEGKELGNVNIRKVRGERGVKEFEIKLKGKKFHTAVAHGLNNARAVMERIKAGEKIDFVEVMACPGGCIGGGGQPKPTDWNVIEKRSNGIYSVDSKKKIRKSHKNPSIQKAYSEFLDEPGSKKAHRILHRHYPKNGKKTS